MPDTVPGDSDVILFLFLDIDGSNCPIGACALLHVYVVSVV
jgi:hypothetical protein